MEMKEKYIARLINEPDKYGFTEVKMVNAPQISTSRWTRQRCWYLCQSPHTDSTPPRTPSSDHTQQTLEEYRFGIFLRKEVGFPFPVDFDPIWREFQEDVVRTENEAFVRGYGKAFAIGCGNCLFGHHDDSMRPCNFSGKKRPTLESAGINLYDTLGLIGWDEYLVREPHQPFQVFGLIMLD